MRSKQKKVLLVVTAVAILAWIVSGLAGSNQTTVPLSSEPLQFDAVRAFNTIEDFVTQNPKRVFGSLESRPATGYLRDILENLGYEWDYMNVGASIKGRTEVGRNILGYKEGSHPGIIAIIAHYDTAPKTIQGAMDNGSGVGVLIELARILAESPAQRSILIVFTDGGAYGMLGARDLVARYPERNRIDAVLSLDHVAVGDLASLRLDETGLKCGFTPPWYRLLALASAKETGLPVESPTGLGEHLERTFYIPWSDQGPFLASGIPAVNLGSYSFDTDYQKTLYHSSEDTIGNLKISSIERFGFAAERIIRSIDELSAIPKDSMDAFRTGDAKFMTPGPFHAILFVFLPLCILFHIYNAGIHFKIFDVVRELLACLATVFPLLTIYLLIGMFRLLKLLPVYDRYPAALKDPILLYPSWGVFSGIVGTAFVVACLCIALFMFGYRKRSRPSYISAKTVLLILMLLTVFFALLHNSYWAVTFLAIPSWLWCLTGRGSTRSKRLLRRATILVAFIPSCIVLWRFASHLDMGLNFFWYQTLALNSGLFSASGYVLGSAAAALGIRFMVIQSHAAGTSES